MSETGPSNADRRREPRVPVEARVDLVFDSFASFISDYVSNVSRGGMFIVTSQLRPPGTRLTFELRLADDYPLVRGRGEVAWTRPHESSAGPAGMAVRFMALDEASRELIERMLAQHLRDGGEPFDLVPTTTPAERTEVVPRPGPNEDPFAVAPGGGATDDAPFAQPSAAAPPDEPPFEAAPAPAPPPAGDDVFAAAPEPPPRAAAEDGLPFAAEPRPEPPLAEPGPPAPVAATPPLEEPGPRSRSQRSAPPPAQPPLEEDLAALDEPEPSPPSRRRRPRRWPVAAAVLLALVAAAAFASWYLRVGPLARPEAPEAAADAAAVPTVTERAASAGEEPTVDAEEPVIEPATIAVAEATPEPAAAPVPTATAVPAPATPASAVEDITWRAAGGVTEVTIRGNGGLDPARVRSARLTGPPRLLLRIRGVEQPFHDRPLVADGPHLAAVRVGFHPELDPNELHVVLDLAGEQVRMTELTGSGATVVVRLAGGG